MFFLPFYTMEKEEEAASVEFTDRNVNGCGNHNKDWRGVLDNLKTEESTLSGNLKVEEAFPANNNRLANPAKLLKLLLSRGVEKNLSKTTNSEAENYKIQEELVSRSPSQNAMRLENQNNDWRQSVSMEVRKILRDRLVQVVIPGFDSRFADSSMNNLLQYFSEVEQHMYNVANSRNEYHTLVAETICKITKELDVKATKTRIALYLHARDCKGLNQRKPCRKPYCNAMREILRHISMCWNTNLCLLTNCISVRMSIDHWRNCRDDNCPICSTIRENQTDKEMKVPFEAESPLDNFLTIIPIDEEEQGKITTPSSQIGLDFDAQVFFPGNLKKIYNKKWQFSLTSDIRRETINKIVQTIFPFSNFAFEGKIFVIIEFARDFENDVCATANSLQEYLDIIRQELFSITNNIVDQRRLKRDLHKFMEQRMVE